MKAQRVTETDDVHIEVQKRVYSENKLIHTRRPFDVEVSYHVAHLDECEEHVYRLQRVTQEVVYPNPQRN